MLLFILFSTVASAQIINVESLRKITDTSGFSGSAGLDFSMTREVAEFIEFGSDTHLQYKMNSHLFLWKNEVNFKSIGGNRFQNRGTTHLRYNYRVNPTIAFELFGQAQYNKASKINFRGLLGTGPRFKLTSSENYKFYLGVLFMLEQEELDDENTPVQRDFRNSSYLSFSLYPNDQVTIVSTTYYQPKLADFSDYRMSSETSLVVKLFSNFSSKTSYTFIYDSVPAEAVPKSQYTLKTGIVYLF